MTAIARRSPDHAGRGPTDTTLITARAGLPFSVWLRRPTKQLPFPLGEPGCTLFRRARHGLWRGLRASRIEPGAEALAPAYHHGSEIEALQRAGLRCRFYEATETLEPDEAELRGLLTARTRVLHLTHFLGFPQDAARWRRWCDERSLLLIEDAAQSWLAARDGRPVGSDGDLAIYCLYKAFGVPDGGMLLSRVPLPWVRARPGAGLLQLGFVHALSLVRRSRLLSRVAERGHREHEYDIKAQIVLGDTASAPSIGTLLALPRIATVEAARKRRGNYTRLLDEFSERLLPAFRSVPAGASPFIFPIETDDKRALLEHLRGWGIRAYDLWPLPHPALTPDAFPRATSLRSRVVGLPVHQELRDHDLERIAAAMRTF